MILNKKILKNALKLLKLSKKNSGNLYDPGRCFLFAESDGSGALNYVVSTSIGGASFSEDDSDLRARGVVCTFLESSWYLDIERLERLLKGEDLGLFIATSNEKQRADKTFATFRDARLKLKWQSDKSGSSGSSRFGVNIAYFALFADFLLFRNNPKDSDNHIIVTSSDCVTMIECVRCGGYAVLAQVKIY